MDLRDNQNQNHNSDFTGNSIPNPPFVDGSIGTTFQANYDYLIIGEIG